MSSPSRSGPGEGGRTFDRAETAAPKATAELSPDNPVTAWIDKVVITEERAS